VWERDVVADGRGGGGGGLQIHRGYFVYLVQPGVFAIERIQRGWFDCECYSEVSWGVCVPNFRAELRR
jgi:hypothetical protein